MEKAHKARKRKKPGGDTIAEAKKSLHDVLAAPDRVPYGLVTSAMNIYRDWSPTDATPARRLRSEIARVVTQEGMDDDTSIIAFWSSIVSSEFDPTWSRCSQPQSEEKGAEVSVKGAEEVPKGGGEGDPPDEDDEDDDTSTKDTKNMRCCTSTIKQILRPELLNNPEAVGRLLELLEQQQEAATDVEDQMYTLAHKATLLVRAYFFGCMSECCWVDLRNPTNTHSLSSRIFVIDCKRRIVVG